VSLKFAGETVGLKEKAIPVALDGRHEASALQPAITKQSDTMMAKDEP